MCGRMRFCILGADNEVLALLGCLSVPCLGVGKFVFAQHSHSKIIATLGFNELLCCRSSKQSVGNQAIPITAVSLATSI